jgi:hypothetical protein
LRRPDDVVVFKSVALYDHAIKSSPVVYLIL